MKKIFYVCLGLFVLFISSCDNHKKDETTKMIDFLDYNVVEVIAWANENDVASKFNYVYSIDTDEEPGSVIAQSLECGKPLTDDIVITVAKEFLLQDDSGKVIIPNVIGKSHTDAKNELTALGLQVDYKYSSSSKEKDKVILCDPLPGVSVLSDTKVILTLSFGQRESCVSINFPIKTDSTGDNTIKVYVDGELDRSKTVCLDASVEYKVFKFYGTGIKEIKFKINNVLTATYTINFSTSEVNII